MSFEVDGKQAGLCESWDYSQAGCSISFDRVSLGKHGIDVRDGQRLDVVVTARRFADPAWVIFEGHGAGG